jgi:hypothetical protein
MLSMTNAPPAASWMLGWMQAHACAHLQVWLEG